MKTMIRKTIVMVLLCFMVGVLLAPPITKTEEEIGKQYYVINQLEKLGNGNNLELASVIDMIVPDTTRINICISQGYKESKLKEDAISKSHTDYGCWQMSSLYHKFDKQKILTYDYACWKWFNLYNELYKANKTHFKAVQRYNGSGQRSLNYAKDVFRIKRKIEV